MNGLTTTMTKHHRLNANKTFIQIYANIIGKANFCSTNISNVKPQRFPKPLGLKALEFDLIFIVVFLFINGNVYPYQK